MAEILADLCRNNPELLDIASRCATSVGNAVRAMQAFGVFYRLMIGDRLVAEIDREGPERFVLGILGEFEWQNPELLHSLHALSSRLPDPFGAAQGLALFYRAVAVGATVGRYQSSPASAPAR
jgi:hypothetical protein